MSPRRRDAQTRPPTTYRAKPTLTLLEDRAVPAIVMTTADSGAGSLRAAIVATNLSTADNTITFSGVSGSIVLATALPPITDTLTITGPGMAVLTVSGNNAVRVFDATAGFTITDLTVTAGKATVLSGGPTTDDGSGGGIRATASLGLTNVTVSGNRAAGGGGGIATNDLRADGVVISGNSSAADGGGVLFTGTGLLSATNTRFSSNTAAGNGGGVYLGDFTDLNSITLTFDNNTAGNSGGGLYAPGPASIGVVFTLGRSAFLGNTATAGAGGGGVRLRPQCLDHPE